MPAVAVVALLLYVGSYQVFQIFLLFSHVYGLTICSSYALLCWFLQFFCFLMFDGPTVLSSDLNLVFAFWEKFLLVPGF